MAVLPCQVQLAPAVQLQVAPVQAQPGPGQALPDGVLPQPAPNARRKQKEIRRAR